MEKKPHKHHKLAEYLKGKCLFAKHKYVIAEEKKLRICEYITEIKFGEIAPKNVAKKNAIAHVTIKYAKIRFGNQIDKIKNDYGIAIINCDKKHIKIIENGEANEDRGQKYKSYMILKYNNKSKKWIGQFNTSMTGGRISVYEAEFSQKKCKL